MNKLVLSLLLVAASSSAFAQKKKTHDPVNPAAAKTYTSLAIGSDIPMADMMMMGVDNKPTSLAQAKTDKGLLVMFSCNTCPYVIKAQPKTMQAINEAKAMEIGMVIINSNQAQRTNEDAPNRMREYSDIQHYTVPYVMDEQSQMADAFGATRTPEVFLFNGKGKLVYKGALEDNPAEPGKSKVLYLSNAMNSMAAGKAINPAETKSIGCGIKRMNM